MVGKNWTVFVSVAGSSLEYIHQGDDVIIIFPFDVDKMHPRLIKTLTLSH